MKFTVRAEDIMTPRNLLDLRGRDGDAERVANAMGFDAIPISRSDGRILEFWSRTDRRRIRIRSAHRTAHDESVESLLAPLGAHLIQFVCYRSEVVGLIDASDLNKPVARMAWLYPMLELERALLDAARTLKISEVEQAAALGKHATICRELQAKAKRQDLEMPLLEYAQFPNLLRAGRQLGLLDLNDPSIAALNAVRKRAAHSGDVVVENRTACARLSMALETARKAARRTQGLRRRKLL
jgi:hypothetical protein